MCVGRCVLKPTPNPRQLPLAWLSGQSNFWAAKSRNAIVSQEIMILQHLHHTRSACHCLNCGTDLIPSCISRGNLKQAGSQGGVPVGCGTGYKNICFFFGVCSDKSLLCICTQLESRMICIDGTDTKTDIWIVLKEVKVVLFLQTGAVKNTLSKKFLKLTFPSGNSVRACLGVNIACLSDLKL